MGDIDTKPQAVERTRSKQPPLYKVIEEQSYRVMMTAHQRGACVVATYTRDIAESKTTEANDMGRGAGHPLEFSTEPEE